MDWTSNFMGVGSIKDLSLNKINIIIDVRTHLFYMSSFHVYVSPPTLVNCIHLVCVARHFISDHLFILDFPQCLCVRQSVLLSHRPSQLIH